MDKVLYFMLFLLSISHGLANPLINDESKSPDSGIAARSMTRKLITAKIATTTNDFVEEISKQQNKLNGLKDKLGDQDLVAFDQTTEDPDASDLELVPSLETNLSNLKKMNKLVDQDLVAFDQTMEDLDVPDPELVSALEDKLGDLKKNGITVDARNNIREITSKENLVNRNFKDNPTAPKGDESKDPSLLQIVVGSLTFLLLVVAVGIACYFLVFKKKAKASGKGRTKNAG